MPTQYDNLCTAIYAIDGIEHTTQMATPVVYRDETIESLLRQAEPSARLVSTKWAQIPKWIAKPTGDTIRHERAMKQIGFRWDGCDWSMISSDRPPRPWGCKVSRYRPPRPPRKGFGAAIGIMAGTHDEFGRPLQQQQERKRTMETKCDYDVTRDMLQTLEQSEVYKGIAEAAAARIADGEDSDTVGREILQTLSAPMPDGGDYDDAAYAIDAYMIGAFSDLYYRDCWNSTTDGEMQELVDEVLADVVAKEMTPRQAAEKWAATHTLRSYGYPAYETQLDVALDVVYGRIRGNGIHNRMRDR